MKAPSSARHGPLVGARDRQIGHGRSTSSERRGTQKQKPPDTHISRRDGRTADGADSPSKVAEMPHKIDPT